MSAQEMEQLPYIWRLWSSKPLDADGELKTSKRPLSKVIDERASVCVPRRLPSCVVLSRVFTIDVRLSGHLTETATWRTGTEDGWHRF
jgi:hypothetical protein